MRCGMQSEFYQSNDSCCAWSVPDQTGKDQKRRGIPHTLWFIIANDKRSICFVMEQLTYPAKLSHRLIGNGVCGAGEIQTANEITHWQLEISRWQFLQN